MDLEIKKYPNCISRNILGLKEKGPND